MKSCDIINQSINQ